MFWGRKGDDSIKVITAIGDEYLNSKLRKYEEYEVIGKDISYAEGILELLEVKKDINIIILSNKIAENEDFERIIEELIKIKNIEIIVFLKEKNEYLENYLNIKKIFKIYFLDNNGYKLFFENILNKNKLENEIESLKKLIISSKKNTKKIKIKYVKDLKLYKRKSENLRCKFGIHKTNNDCKTIVISGVCGSGKTMISKVLMNFIKCKNRKVFLLNLKAKTLESNSVFDTYEIKKYIEKIKQKYDYLIIDTNNDFKNIKTVLYSGDKIIFLVEPNLSEIEKAKNILDVYINDFEVNADKIKIVFNKTNKYKMAESILEELFEGFEIIGEIKYSENYNLIINKNKIENYSKKEYEKIYSAVQKENLWI